MTGRRIAIRRMAVIVALISSTMRRLFPSPAWAAATLPVLAGSVTFFALFSPLSASAAPAVSAQAASPTASVPAAVTVKPTLPATADALLDGINPAAQRLTYEGTFVFQRGDTVQSSRIVHFVDGAGERYQKVDSLDGKPRSVVQHNDDLFTFLPESHTVILDRRKTPDNFPALLSGGSAAVLSVYKPVLEGNDRVAGVDCRVVSLHPLDQYRFAYRLYIDPSSGLLMRAQTLDGEGRVLEQVAFSQLQVGSLAPEVKQAIRVSTHKLGDWKQVRAPAEAVNMEAAGWTLDTGVPGFRKVLELRRPMAAREPGMPPVPVDQAVFTDGVTAVSLFIEPVDKSDRKPGEGRSGATHVLAEQVGTFWVTVIGEVPFDTLRKIAASIQFKTAP